MKVVLEVLVDVDESHVDSASDFQHAALNALAALDSTVSHIVHIRMASSNLKFILDDEGGI